MIWKMIAGIVVAFVIFVFVARTTSSTVKVKRTLNAPIAKVWNLWNDPETIKKWWSPKDFTAPTIQNDFRVGGKFLFSMKSPKGEIAWNTGIYKEIVPNQKIVAAMSFSDETGRVLPSSEIPVPGKWPDEVTWIVEFKEVDGKAEVTVTEIGIPLIMKMLAKMGWEQQFDKIEELLNRS